MTQGRREEGGAGGGGGEADKRQKRAPPDAATIAVLRAEATTHGAPAILPDQYLSTWLKYAKSPAPELVRTPDGIFLKSSGSTEEANYYVYYLWLSSMIFVCLMVIK